MDVVVQDQGKEDDYHTNGCGKQGLAKFEQARSAVNVVVKSGNIVKKNPDGGDKGKSEEIAVGKLQRNVDSEILRLDNCFSVNKKSRPA